MNNGLDINELYNDFYTMMNIKYLKERIFNEKSDIAKDISSIKRIDVKPSDNILEGDTMMNESQLDESFYVKITSNDLFNVLSTLKKTDTLMMLIYIDYQDIYFIYKITDFYPMVVFKPSRETYIINQGINDRAVFRVKPSIIESFRSTGKKSGSTLKICKTDDNNYVLEYNIISNKCVSRVNKMDLDISPPCVVNNLFVKTFANLDMNLEYFAGIEQSFVYIMFSQSEDNITSEIHKASVSCAKLIIDDNRLDLVTNKNGEVMQMLLTSTTSKNCIIWNTTTEKTYQIIKICKGYKVGHMSLSQNYTSYWCVATYMDIHPVLYRIVAMNGNLITKPTSNKINTLFDKLFSIEMYILEDEGEKNMINEI